MVSPKPVSLSVRKGHCRPGHQKCWSHGAPVCMGGAPFSGSMVMAGRQRAGGVTPRLTPGGPYGPLCSLWQSRLTVTRECGARRAEFRTPVAVTLLCCDLIQACVAAVVQAGV